MSESKTFQELRIGKVVARNRLVRAAAYERLGTTSHEATDELVEYYRNLAAGGVGSVITSFCLVREDAHGYSRMLGAYDDSQVPGLTAIATAVHEGGACAYLQLVFCGSGGKAAADGSAAPGPSTLVNPTTGVPAAEMDEVELARMKADYVAAARRAKEAGFDGVEVHAAHGYLFSQFLSPDINKRIDCYGGDARGRAQFAIEVIDAVRAELGEGYPVMLKLNSSDGREGGLTEQESLEAACALAPHLDAIEVSGGGWSVAGRKGNHGLFAPYALELASRVDTPVILTGGNRLVAEMDELAEKGIAGFGIARPLVSEPDLPRRWEQDPAYVPRCISCGKCFSLEECHCILDRKKAQA